MHIARDEAVSEIVGALLLVVIVSSAAFGFGIFVHQQQKETQAEQAAALAVRLEKVTVQGLTPVDGTDACTGGAPTGPGAGTWDTLSFTLMSHHLHDTHLTQLSVNKLALKTVFVAPFGAGDGIDLSLPPTDPGYKPLIVPAGQPMVLQLQHVDCDAAGGSPFFAPPGSGLPTGIPLDLEFVTALGNHVEHVFSPPIAIASVEPTPGVATNYILVGTGSQAGSEDAFVAKWTWDYWHGACGVVGDAGDLGPLSGHRKQIYALITADSYCVLLTVTDNNGLVATTQITFTA